METNRIDWQIVNKHLKCPYCGEAACIEPESDGYEAYHVHRFRLTREEALRITRENGGQPTLDEMAAEIDRLKKVANDAESRLQNLTDGLLQRIGAGTKGFVNADDVARLVKKAIPGGDQNG